MKVKMISPAEVKPYWRNPRKIDRAVAAVKASITEFGFRQPIVVDGENVIIVGHTRHKASLELGLAKVPVVVADDLTPQQVKAYRIADNKTNELAEWDNTLLIPELREFTDLQSLAVYFPHTDLDALLRDTSGVGSGTSFVAPTNEDVQKASDRQDKVFEDRDAKGKAAMMDLTCPHCGCDFVVDRDELARRPAHH